MNFKDIDVNADLSLATLDTIDQLREAIRIQKFLESNSSYNEYCDSVIPLFLNKEI